MSTIPPFSEEAKYSWPLNRDSLVIDVGAYEGNFSRLIAEKFDCDIWAFEPVFFKETRKNIGQRMRTTVFEAGLGSHESHELFGVKGDSTGSWADSNNVMQVSILPVSILYAWNHIHLLKLNCEGGEYAILERIIADNKAQMFDAIMVQFHRVQPHSEERRQAIVNALSQTHNTVWSSPWVWEGFQIKR